jgi:hypothetical protein
LRVEGAKGKAETLKAEIKAGSGEEDINQALKCAAWRAEEVELPLHRHEIDALMHYA